MCALGGSVRDNAINAHNCQDQSEYTHRSGQLRAKAEEEEAIYALQRLRHRLDFRYGNAWSQLPDLAFDLALQRLRRNRRPHVNCTVRHVILGEWHIEKWTRRILHNVSVFSGLHHTNYFPERSLRALSAEVLA